MSLPIRVNSYSSYKETNGPLSLNWTVNGVLPYQKKLIRIFVA